MRILMVAAEAPPLQRAGALTNVMNALPNELRERGHEFSIASDSDVTSRSVTNYGAACAGGGNKAVGKAMVQSMQVTVVTTTLVSVRDGDWALLEEYIQNASMPIQGYVQGYHGLVKTLRDNIYYYQDSLGSTSHVANASGHLLEWYKYDLYGKPKYFDANGTQLTASNCAIVDLGDGGARWMPELGLYDDRNRFMSPELARFLQPDPTGFKGDASNLYRYCGNDWANKTDPMGLDAYSAGNEVRREMAEMQKPDAQVSAAERLDLARVLQSAGAIKTARINDEIARREGLTIALEKASQPANTASPPTISQDVFNKGKGLVEDARGKSDQTFYDSHTTYHFPDGRTGTLTAARTDQAPGGAWKETSVEKPKGALLDQNGHLHPSGFKTFSPSDKRLGTANGVWKNHDARNVFARGHGYDAWYKGWRYEFNDNGSLMTAPRLDP